MFCCKRINVTEKRASIQARQLDRRAHPALPPAQEWTCMNIYGHIIANRRSQSCLETE
jgi:hypothetical protein